MKQKSFSDMEYRCRKKKTKREEFLEIMDEIIPWDEWVSLIVPHYPTMRRNASRSNVPGSVSPPRTALTGAAGKTYIGVSSTPRPQRNVSIAGSSVASRRSRRYTRTASGTGASYAEKRSCRNRQAARRGLSGFRVIGMKNSVSDNVIYTHDEAVRIVELFEDVLDEYGIKVPSPEDGEREPDNEAKLYGSVYWDLMDGVEERVINLLQTHKPDTAVVKYKYSGRL